MPCFRAGSLAPPGSSPLTAALLGRQLGLPHTDPLAVLACRSKAHFRERLREIAPEASAAHWALPYTQDLGGPLGLPLPFFIKPVKATYSVLARRVDTPEQLRQHLAFAPYERYIIKRLVQAFNDHGFFNIEFFYDPATDRLRLIGASQARLRPEARVQVARQPPLHHVEPGRCRRGVPARPLRGHLRASGLAGRAVAGASFAEFSVTPL